MEDVVATPHLQDELPVLFAARDRTTELGMTCENLGSLDNRLCDGTRQLRRLLVEKRAESIQVGESIVRPLQFY